MNGASTSTAACFQYELEIEISASADRVWRAIFEQTNYWWLPDFHVTGERSTVTFDPQPGGSGLLETRPDGGGLLWYSVQMYVPDEFKIYLFGFVAPEWGGPCTSQLKLAIEAKGDRCVLRVTDARHGSADEESVQSTRDGWRQLFTDGLKAFVETDR